MASTKDNGSRRRAQVKTETPVSEEKVVEKKIGQKEIEKPSRFQPGELGACEMWMWKFTGTRSTHPGEQVERVAAETLDEALRFMRRRYTTFTVNRAEYEDLIAVLSGRPLPNNKQ